MLHPSKRGIICDLSGKVCLIENNKLSYHYVTIKKGNDNLLNLDISSESLKEIIDSIKLQCKLCGSKNNVNNNVEIKDIQAYKDHNDVNDNISFMICNDCFLKLKERVSKVINDTKGKT